RYRAATALLLLGPWTPMLFQGQEFGASSPFLYFADHQPELAALVSDGRREFLRQFPSLRSWPPGRDMPDPAAIETFRRAQLDPAERDAHDEQVALHRDLIARRRSTPVIDDCAPHGLDGVVLGPQIFALRYFGDEPGDQHAPADRLLVVNFGGDFFG